MKTITSHVSSHSETRRPRLITKCDGDIAYFSFPFLESNPSSKRTSSLLLQMHTCYLRAAKILTLWPDILGDYFGFPQFWNFRSTTLLSTIIFLHHCTIAGKSCSPSHVDAIVAQPAALSVVQVTAWLVSNCGKPPMGWEWVSRVMHTQSGPSSSHSKSDIWMIPFSAFHLSEYAVSNHFYHFLAIIWITISISDSGGFYEYLLIWVWLAGEFSLPSYHCVGILVTF